MAYVPNPTDATQPVESVFAKTAAAEFRALKQYIQGIVSGAVLGNLTPGMIVPFAFNAAPPGWLVCDGSLQSRATFANLWALANASAVSEATWAASNWGAFATGDGSTTFRLPDLRGEFLRGSDLARGINGGHAMGTWQIATAVFDQWSFNSGFLPDDNASIVNEDESNGYGNTGHNLAVGAVAPGGSKAVKRVRPRNVALTYCVKT